MSMFLGDEAEGPVEAGRLRIAAGDSRIPAADGVDVQHNEAVAGEFDAGAADSHLPSGAIIFTCPIFLDTSL